MHLTLCKLLQVINMKISVKKIPTDWFVKTQGDTKSTANSVIDIDNWGFGCSLNSTVSQVWDFRKSFELIRHCASDCVYLISILVVVFRASIYWLGLELTSCRVHIAIIAICRSPVYKEALSETVIGHPSASGPQTNSAASVRVPCCLTLNSPAYVIVIAILALFLPSLFK